MITRAHRFHGHASLPALYRKAQTVRGQFMSVRSVERRADQPYRLAVVVSRKVHKSAVVRNRIRRRLYEIVRVREALLSGSFDIAITVYSDSIASLDQAQLEDQLCKLFIKAGILLTDESML